MPRRSVPLHFIAIAEKCTTDFPDLGPGVSLPFGMEFYVALRADGIILVERQFAARPVYIYIYT